MNILSKMFTAIKGGINEAGEAIIDSQAQRILDQEIRDASEELKTTRNNLLELIAKQKLSEEKESELKEKISEHEAYALKALDKKDETLALEVANKIADFETKFSNETSKAETFSASVEKLREAVALAERSIQHMKQQIATVRATENVQRAQAAVAMRHSSSNTRLHTAMDSLERIKEKQSLRNTKIKTSNEVTSNYLDTDLDQKLQQAGIKAQSNSGDKVLNRLKNL